MTSGGPSLTERLDRIPLGPFHVALIAVIFTALAFDHMDQVVLSFVIPKYREEWGLSAAIASINPLTGLTATFLGAIFWGTVADRYGRKRTLMITLLIFAVTSGINGFATGFTQIVLTCVVMGVGVGGAIPLSFMLLAEFTPAKYRGMVMVAVGIISITGGFLIASAGALFLMDSFGWRSLFLIGLTPAFMLPVIYWIVPESPRYLLSRGRSREAVAIVERLERRAGIASAAAPATPDNAASSESGDAAGDAAGEGSLSLSTIGELWKPRYRRRTLMLWSYAFGFGFFTFGFLTWLPTVLHQAGFSDGSIHLNTTVMDLLAIPSALITALLFFYWSTKRTLILYPVVAGAAMVVLSVLVWSDSLNVAWLLLVGGVVFFFGTILLGVFGPYAAEVYPTAIRGTGSGWATGFSRFGALVAIPIGGLILSSGLPAYLHQLIFGIPLLIVGLVMAAMGIETRQRRLEEIS